MMILSIGLTDFINAKFTESHGRIVSQNKAFTIIELMMVVGLLAIMATLAVPNIRQALRGQGPKTIMGQMQDQIRWLQAQSLLKNKRHQIRFEPDQKTVTFWSANPKSNTTSKWDFSEVSNSVIKKLYMNDDISSQYDQDTITIYTDGTISPWTWIACDDQDQCLTLTTRYQRGQVTLLYGEQSQWLSS